MLLSELGGSWLLPPWDFPHFREHHPMDHDSNSSGHTTKRDPTLLYATKAATAKTLKLRMIKVFTLFTFPCGIMTEASSNLLDTSPHAVVPKFSSFTNLRVLRVEELRT